MAAAVNREVRRFPDLAAASAAAAEAMVERAGSAVSSRGAFALALCGGTTPKPLFEKLAEPALAARLPWGQTKVFWGDERCFPPEHFASNYSLAWEFLLRRVPVPAGNIHRIQGELPPEEAARDYEALLRRHCPRGLDLALLGIGSDGHTASLFPDKDASREQERWVVAVPPAGTPRVARVTLTLPALCASRTALFLVTRAGKEAALDPLLGDGIRPFPAGNVLPREDLLWFVSDR